MKRAKKMGLVLTMASVFIVVVLMVFFSPGASFAISSDIQNQIAALENENDDIQKGYNDLNGDIGKYNIVEKQLEADISDNEAKREPISNKVSALNSEKESINSDVAAYNAECGGRTFYFDRGERPAYERCVSIKNSAETRVQSWEARHTQVQNEIDAFNEAATGLKQKTEEQKTALANLNDREKQLQAREAAWIRKYNLLINSPAFRQLVTAEGIAKECKKMAEHGDLEGAHRCLQGIWDGANPR